MTTPIERVPVRIVIADDRAEHRALLVETLCLPRYRTVVAHDGLELLELLSGWPRGYFAAVVTDVFMPGLRGTEVLARVGSRSRFILVTGYCDASIDHSAAVLGAAAVLRKPFDPHHLLQLVDSVIAQT